MSEKRFRVRFEQEDGRGEIVNEKGVELTAREVVDLLNEQEATIQLLQDEIDELKKDIDIYEYEEKKHSETARKLYDENKQLKQEIKQYWKCRDKWKQEAKELKKEADYFERKKCEYWNMYNEAHSDRIILKKENEELRKQCFELEKDYLIETSDISDKIYLRDEIKELKQRYGVGDE